MFFAEWFLLWGWIYYPLFILQLDIWFVSNFLVPPQCFVTFFRLIYTSIVFKIKNKKLRFGEKIGVGDKDLDKK